MTAKIYVPNISREILEHMQEHLLHFADLAEKVYNDSDLQERTAVDIEAAFRAASGEIEQAIELMTFNPKKPSFNNMASVFNEPEYDNQGHEIRGRPRSDY